MLLDIWLVFRRHMAISLRNPAWVLIGIMQPLLYLLLFWFTWPAWPLASCLASCSRSGPGS